jgi:hypothetical protein
MQLEVGNISIRSAVDPGRNVSANIFAAGSNATASSSREKSITQISVTLALSP